VAAPIEIQDILKDLFVESVYDAASVGQKNGFWKVEDESGEIGYIWSEGIYYVSEIDIFL
jgi:hypothetical protein